MSKSRDLAGSVTFLIDIGSDILENDDVGTSVQAYSSNLTSFLQAFTLPTDDGTSGQALVTNGSGAVAFSTVSSLPSQTGNSGKYLTTDGSDASWVTIASEDALPSQTGNSGKYLTTDGSTVSWSTVSASGSSLPSQTGNSGKYLTTDGSDASWATVSGLQASNNLSDVSSATTSRENLNISILQKSYRFSGPLQVTTGTGRIWIHKACTLTQIDIFAATAPVGNDATLRINKNGSSATTVTLSDGSTSNTGISANVSFSAGDYLTVDITAVGSNNYGADLYMILTFN